MRMGATVRGHPDGLARALRCRAMTPRCVLPVFAAVLLLAACGGGSDFSGKASVPSGYATYRGDRVTFAHPRGWQVAQRKDPDGGSSVRITPKNTATTPYGLILLVA